MERHESLKAIVSRDNAAMFANSPPPLSTLPLWFDSGQERSHGSFPVHFPQESGWQRKRHARVRRAPSATVGKPWSEIMPGGERDRVRWTWLHLLGFRVPLSIAERKWAPLHNRHTQLKSASTLSKLAYYWQWHWKIGKKSKFDWNSLGLTNVYQSCGRFISFVERDDNFGHNEFCLCL